jgi:hypothetical protein
MMNQLFKLLKKERNEYVAIALMSLFVVFNVSVPEPLAGLIDTLPGRVAVMALAASLLYVHRVLGVIAIIFAYILIHRSEKKTGTYQMRKFLPSQAKKDRHLSAMNQFPTTLEEQVVQNMVPLVKDGPMTSANYKPVSENLHDAAKL